MPPLPPPLEPAQALFARDIATNALKAEHPVTRRVVDAIPLDTGDDRPDAVAYGESYDSAQTRKEPA